MSTATVDQRKIVRWKWQGVQRIEGKVVLGLFSGGKDVSVALPTG